MSALTSNPAFFEAKYRNSEDPWDFRGSAYETRRYDATLAALAHRRYSRALEPGCSIGVLTERLATLCDRVDAFDFSATAVERARLRCAHLPHVHIEPAALSSATSTADCDLLVLSEIGYYFTATEWASLAAQLTANLPSGATLLAVHWLGHSQDHHLSGDHVHQVLESQPHLQLQLAELHPSFRLNRWSRL